VSGFHCRRRWPREEPKSGGEVPVQRLHRPIRHNCHTSSNSLICKQTIALYGCWDGRGEGVSDPQVVHKPHQPTGTPASHQRVSCSLHTTALGFIVVCLPSKKSQIWKILIWFHSCCFLGRNDLSWLRRKQGGWATGTYRGLLCQVDGKLGHTSLFVLFADVRQFWVLIMKQRCLAFRVGHFLMVKVLSLGSF